MTWIFIAFLPGKKTYAASPHLIEGLIIDTSAIGKGEAILRGFG
jgi:hypothetical protein